MYNIRFLVMDVDGTLTDGKIYMGQSGELLKAFNVKDGCGIKDILPSMNIVPIIITARTSAIVANRCHELGVKELYQGVRNKRNCLDRILSLYSLKDKVKWGYNNVAYIGDDILDLQCMESIRMGGGVIGCPIDAVDAVVQISNFICTKTGGNGAVREFIEWLVTLR